MKSYSAVAAKQNNGHQQFPQAVNSNNNKNKTTRPPGFTTSPMLETTPAVIGDNKSSPINQEQLNNAKQQYISNAKQAVAAGMGNTNVPKPAVNQSPMSTTVQSVTVSKNPAVQPPRQPVVSPQSSSSDSAAPVPKLSYSRMATSKIDQKTDPIQGTTPRGQGGLSKFGKVNKFAEGGMSSKKVISKTVIYSFLLVYDLVFIHFQFLIIYHQMIFTMIEPDWMGSWILS